jgi:hypothetical protein
LFRYGRPEQASPWLQIAEESEGVDTSAKRKIGILTLPAFEALSLNDDSGMLVSWSYSRDCFFEKGIGYIFQITECSQVKSAQAMNLHPYLSRRGCRPRALVRHQPEGPHPLQDQVRPIAALLSTEIFGRISSTAPFDTFMPISSF